MEDEESEGESEIMDFPTTSVLTMTSSKFKEFSEFTYVQEEEEDDEQENEESLNVPNESQQEFTPDGEEMELTAIAKTGEPATLSVPTLASSSSRFILIQNSLDEFSSMGTEMGSDVNPSQVTQSIIESKSTFKKPLGSESHPQPFYYVELKRLRAEEKFDAFSEDEEPVLRTSYSPFEPKSPECPEPVIRKEKIALYDIRKGKLPPQATIENSKITSQPGRIETRSSIARKSVRLPPLEWKFIDFTPQQRDLKNVSFEELSPVEVETIKGLWKCITHSLWTFGALTTIKIRGHLNFNDQKATPDVMMKCRFLWPHANQAMKSLETVVLNLHKPETSHKVVYELGRKHGKLKIPLSETQSEMVVNSFLYTFHQHVHPKMTLKEIKTLRKFSNITMFLFIDGSRWDSEPLNLY